MLFFHIVQGTIEMYVYNIFINIYLNMQHFILKGHCKVKTDAWNDAIKRLAPK